MPLKERIAITLYVCGAILIAFISAFAYNGYSLETSAEGIGFAIGTLFIPTVIAYAVRGRFLKRPSNHLGFARWLWWGTFIFVGIDVSNYRREHMTTADVHTVLKQAVEMTPDSAIDNSGKTPEKIEEEGQYRDLMRSYFKEIMDKRSVLDGRRPAIDARLDGIYQPESYKPARAKVIIAALNDSIALDNDYQIWENDLVPAFQARVQQSGLTNSEQQSTLRGFQNAFSSSQLWPTLHTYLETDVELDQVSIQFYQAILKGNTEQANSYIDRIQALCEKDTDLAAQVRKLRSASGKQAGFDGHEKIFQKTSGQ